MKYKQSRPAPTEGLLTDEDKDIISDLVERLESIHEYSEKDGQRGPEMGCSTCYAILRGKSLLSKLQQARPQTEQVGEKLGAIIHKYCEFQSIQHGSNSYYVDFANMFKEIDSLLPFPDEQAKQRPVQQNEPGRPTVEDLVDVYAAGNPADDHEVGLQSVAEFIRADERKAIATLESQLKPMSGWEETVKHMSFCDPKGKLGCTCGRWEQAELTWRKARQGMVELENNLEAVRTNQCSMCTLWQEMKKRKVKLGKGETK